MQIERKRERGRYGLHIKERKTERERVLFVDWEKGGTLILDSLT